MINVSQIKKDFPLLSRQINGVPLTYLDNAATTHKPQQVIDAISEYYSNYNANVSRGVYTLAEESTQIYEDSRAKLAHFLGVKPQEIIFTYNSTYALNIAVFGYVAHVLNEGDVVVSLISEHHSSLVPLQQAAHAKGAKLAVLELTDAFDFPMTEFEKLLKNGNVKVLSVAHISNVLGTEFDIKAICELAHKYGCLVIVDGSQAVGHKKLNLAHLGCDFYAFSAHKMLGPMGIGVLYARQEILTKMDPMFFGGGMIKRVSPEQATFKESPEGMEPGTPNVADVYALAKAVEYLEGVGMHAIEEHEKKLTQYALEKFKEIPEIKVVGNVDTKNRLGIVSFVLDGIHSHDVAAVLSSKNICVRSGQHCTMPLHDLLRISSSIRASFYIYNDESDVAKLVEGIKHAINILKH
jgi:cysteine desulfurase/selenocysteine lyase